MIKCSEIANLKVPKLETQKILKEAGEQPTCKGVRLTVEFATVTLETRRMQIQFKRLRGKESQPRLLYSAKTPFRSKGKLKTFSDKARCDNLLLGDLPYKKFKEELRLKANDTMWQSESVSVRITV